MPTRRTLKKILGDGNTQLGDDPLAARGAVVSKTGLTCTDYSSGIVRHTRLTFASCSIATADNTTNGANGSQRIYNFPTGAVAILGAGADLQIARAGTGLSATAAVVASLGSVTAATDATLSSTEADIMASVAATLTAGAGVVVGRGVPVTFATGAGVFLNFAVPDAGTSAADALIVNGFVDLFWIQLTD